MTTHQTSPLPAAWQADVDSAIEAATQTVSPDEAVVVSMGAPTNIDSAVRGSNTKAPKPAPKTEEPAASASRTLRERLLDRKRALDEREQRTRAQYAETKANLRGWKAREAEIMRELEASRADPVGYLIAKGHTTPEFLAERLISGKPHPGEAGHRAAREAAALREEIQRSEQQRFTEQRSVAQERELVRFVGEARADETRWPLVSRFSEARLRERGMQIATSARAPISNAEILDRIESELAEIADLRSTPAAAAKAPAPARNGGARNVLSESDEAILIRRQR